MLSHRSWSPPLDDCAVPFTLSACVMLRVLTAWSFIPRVFGPAPSIKPTCVSSTPDITLHLPPFPLPLTSSPSSSLLSSSAGSTHQSHVDSPLSRHTPSRAACSLSSLRCLPLPEVLTSAVTPTSVPQLRRLVISSSPGLHHPFTRMHLKPPSIPPFPKSAAF